MIGSKSYLHGRAHFDEPAGWARKRRQATKIMKAASSSRSFGRLLSNGRLTQLEWLDQCANTLALEGVVFDAVHFPRTDVEYLAQLKKLCVDLGLTIAGLATETLFDPAGAPWLERAQMLGSPLVIASAPAVDSDPNAWPRLVATSRERASEAKARNIPIAVRNAANTLCGDGAALKRLTKDCDSSWLRYAPSIVGLSSDELAPLAARSVIGILEVEKEPSEPDLAPLIRAAATLRGFTLIDVQESDDPTPTITRLRESLHASSKLH
ncbi:MAG TPA: hypothetical protein VGZ00_04265 [Candidatus Baltobacteraceae bacterium]|nr:hypothetical protein [Candidatus Baltobacteraceae bacterium]